MNNTQLVAQKETKGTKADRRSRRRSVLFVGFCSTLAFQLLLPLVQPAHAATNDLTSLLQRGLFEEEANRNLDAAIVSYDALAKQFDKNRQIAATAIFRLGECYRKLGRTNEAIQQYERIVRDFSDQQMLVTLSRQNLAGMGKVFQSETAPAQGSAWTRAAEEAAAEAATIKVQIDALRALPIEHRNSAIRQFHSTERLARLEQALTEAEEKHRQTAVNYNSDHPQFKVATANLEAIHEKVNEETVAILTGLQLKHKIAAERAKVLQSQSGATALRTEEPQPVLDEEEKEIRRLQAMIQNSPDLVNAPTGEQRLTPLANAARAGQLRVAEFLLKSGAEVNRISGSDAPLHHAVRGGHKAAVELLIKNGADINAQNTQGDTALHIAAGFGFQAVAEALIHHKADPNAKNRQGETPLHEAAQNGRANLVELLIATGADVNALDHGGIAALSKSLLHNQRSAFEVLLKAKADPNAGNTNQPLLVAIQKRDAAVVRRLLEAGADPNRSGSLSGSVTLFDNSSYQAGTPIPPLHLAVHYGAELAELLLKFGGNPNVTRPDGRPLMVSWNVLSRTNLLEAMLQAGADPNARDQSSSPPLLDAAGSANPAAVELLLRYKADVRATNKGWTALHSAIHRGSRGVLEALLKAGADPNARNSDGKTPLDLAKERINPPMGAIVMNFNEQLPPDAMKPEEIIALLRQHGALDDLPDFSSIRVTRQGMSRPKMVFQSDPAVSNRFTLLETLLRFYGEQRKGPYRISFNDSNVDPRKLVFPDLKRIIVHRPARSGKSEQAINVNLLNATNNIDCSRDIPLKFGDVVEVPVREYGLHEPRVDLTEEQWSTAVECLKGEVKVTVRNQSRTVKLNATDALLRTTLQAPEVQSLLLSSSDLSRVKVTRRHVSGKAQEWIVNCDSTRSNGVTPVPGLPIASPITYQWSSAGATPVGSASADRPLAADLWLRDGDVIEIPEK